MAARSELLLVAMLVALTLLFFPIVVNVALSLKTLSDALSRASQDLATSASRVVGTPLAYSMEAFGLKFKFLGVQEIPCNFRQGVATDGEYWFFSDKNALYVVHAKPSAVPELGDVPSASPVLISVPAIPPSLASTGYERIGDIDYHKGFIYAPVSGPGRKSVIVIYSAKTLQPIKVIGPIPLANVTWVAVDKNGLIYTSQFSYVREIHIYAENGTRMGVLVLDRVLNRVEGGVVASNILYLSTDNGGDWVYAVNLETGTVKPVIRFAAGCEQKGLEYWNGKLYIIEDRSGMAPNMLAILQATPCNP